MSHWLECGEKQIYVINCIRCKNKGEERRGIQWCSCLGTPASLPIKGKWSDCGTQPNTFATLVPIRIHTLRSQHKWLIEWNSSHFLYLPWPSQDFPTLGNCQRDKVLYIFLWIIDSSHVLLRSHHSGSPPCWRRATSQLNLVAWKQSY